MQGFVNTYDPKKVIITFGGVPITGFADGTFVQIDPNAEMWTKKVGADGEVTRSQSNDNTHTVQITLQQSSASNDYLSTCMNADKLTGMGMLPLSITDLYYSSAQCIIVSLLNKPPTHHFWYRQTLLMDLQKK